MTQQTTNELEALAQQAEAQQAASAAEQAQAQPGAGEGAQPGQAPGQSNAEIIAGTLEIGREVFCAVAQVQAPRHVLDDPTVQALGDAWGRVADKRGWNLAGIMGDYAAEIAAIMLTVTVGGKLVKATRAELDAKAAAEANDKPAETAGVVLDAEA